MDPYFYDEVHIPCFSFLKVSIQPLNFNPKNWKGKTRKVNNQKHTNIVFWRKTFHKGVEICQCTYLPTDQSKETDYIVGLVQST